MSENGGYTDGPISDGGMDPRNKAARQAVDLMDFDTLAQHALVEAIITSLRNLKPAAPSALEMQETEVQKWYRLGFEHAKELAVQQVEKFN